jgi:hypothetical protein
VGEQLEYYLKDSLVNSFKLTQSEKEEEHHKAFSWCGNQNNPPDIIIKGSDAFEIKKIEGRSNALALNSSPPKDRLWRSDSRIISKVRECESPDVWESKDLFYVIGQIEQSQIRHLFFVHGLCYSAEKEIYNKVAIPLKRNISDAIVAAGLEEGKDTNELGRVNRVDPLGITNLRIRGMWTIENPRKVFSYLNIEEQKNFNLVALMTETKFNSFPIEDIKLLTKNNSIKVKAEKIKNPNNPAQRIAAMRIIFGW